MPISVSHKVETFFKQFPLKRYDKGHILILASEDPRYIYFLIKGQVREYDISYKGDEVVVNVFKPPSFFPMSWAINKTPNNYFFEAVSDISVHEAPPAQTVEFVKDNPDVAYDLLKRVYMGTDGLLRRTAHLMGGSAKNRLLFELITEARRFAKQSKDGSYSITISETEIGTRAGLSRETVSREINGLKKQGLISTSRKAIVVKDINQLEEALGTEL